MSTACDTILFWSGGFDSTAALLHMWQNPDKFPKVRIVSCRLKNARNCEEDAKARAEVHGIMRKLRLKNKEVKLHQFDEYAWDISANTGYQSHIWAALSAMSISDPFDEYEPITLSYGYVRGDDFWHVRPHFEQAVKSLAAMHFNRPVSFYYPFEWHTKRELVKTYLDFPAVFDNISWGGDTETVKLKEKEDLEFIYKELRNMYNADNSMVEYIPDIYVPQREQTNEEGEGI